MDFRWALTNARVAFRILYTRSHIHTHTHMVCRRILFRRLLSLRLFFSSISQDS